MDCTDYQERILEAMDQLSPGVDPAVEAHLSHCETCRGFFAAQQMLDQALSAEFAGARLSRQFSTHLRQNLQRESSATWLELLPDVLNLAGAGALAAWASAQFSDEPWVLAGSFTLLASVASLLVLSRQHVEELED